ncbi:MAG: CehA/McbA family metallohydrolase [Thermoproteota archaeon]|nr:CehA/McbA family metallohydrolase [Thermoproteota archaeon]
MPLKIDLHVHTCYSYDAVTTLEEVIAYSKKRGLNGVAITDHDTLKGALKLQQKNNFLIIPGMEISTRQGHVLAINITTPIPPALDVHETIERIHEAGGVAVAAHPTTLAKGGLRRKIGSGFDAIEVINSSAVPFFFSVYLNRKIAERFSLPQTAGSDAHCPFEIGTAYTIVDANSKLDEIVEAIRKGATVPYGKPIPWRMRVRREALTLKRKL